MEEQLFYSHLISNHSHRLIIFIMMSKFQPIKIEEVYQVFNQLNNYKMLSKEKVLRLWFLCLVKFQKVQGV